MFGSLPSGLRFSPQATVKVLNESHGIVQACGRERCRLASVLILDGTCQVHLSGTREVLSCRLEVNRFAIRVEAREPLAGPL